MQNSNKAGDAGHGSSQGCPVHGRSQERPLPMTEPFHRPKVHVLLLHTLLQPGWVAATQCNLLCSE